MTGKVLASADYRLVITDRSTRLGHVLAVGFGAAFAALVVFGWGL